MMANGTGLERGAAESYYEGGGSKKKGAFRGQSSSEKAEKN